MAQQVILIVEDDEPLRALLRTALRLEGFEVVEAGDGLQALRLVEASPPDLVLLDLGLPHVDGVSVRRDLAAQFYSRQIPIVVVTGSTEDLAYLDVNCVLRKPVTVDQVLRAVRLCLRSATPSIEKPDVHSLVSHGASANSLSAVSIGENLVRDPRKPGS